MKKTVLAQSYWYEGISEWYAFLGKIKNSDSFHEEKISKEETQKRYAILQKRLENFPGGKIP